MKIEIAKHERMASSGSSLLRSIQNENLPVLDLIVRESIQNSLDAAAPDSKFVGVEFQIGEFVPSTFNSYFDGIKDELNRRYSGKQCKYLAIRDTQTVGLTGPLHYTEVSGTDFGNLQKLVYEISKPQTNEGAGGSWGLGKTVYFRAGIGLVIYYSRIQEANGRYASRLAATLVEDETKENQLIKYPDDTVIKRGIAWWGDRISLLKPGTRPVTDQSVINGFLRLLGITPYPENATGTMIIIPYIEEAKLLSGIAPSESIATGRQGGYYWLNSAEEYLKLSVQRWYTPRMSRNYEGAPYLRASVNGALITHETMAPYYRVLLQLYENTLKTKQFVKGSCKIGDIEYYCVSVDTRGILGQSSGGYISYAKVTEKELEMLPPENSPNPYSFVGKYDIERVSNPPLLAYIRRPGMVVSYETTGAWLDGVLPTNNGEYIVALFVLNSTNTVKGYDKSLEEYVRKGEKSDHTAWFDWAFTDRQAYIVSRLKSNAAKKLKQTFVQNMNSTTALTHSGLERVLADFLLPPDGFGNRSNRNGEQKRHGGQSSSHSGKSPVLKVIDTSYNGDEVTIEFDFRTGKGTKDVVIELQVITENNAFSADSWEKDTVIGTAFPLLLTGFMIEERVDPKKTTTELSEPLSTTELYSKAFGIRYGVRVSDTMEVSRSFRGVLTFTKTRKQDGKDILGGIAVNKAERREDT